MNLSLLYQWTQEQDKHFPKLGRWQVLGMAWFSYGIILAQSCRLSRVAMHLTNGQQASSMERRLQRWLANPRLRMEWLFEAWVGWVLGQWGNAALLLVVDETKLGNQVAVMMVSLSYQGSALPLIWRVYALSDDPLERQVGVLQDLLERLRMLLPADCQAVLLADRGLGTSPTGQTILSQQGWDYLLRVQRSTRIRREGKVQALGQMVGYGQRWSGRAQVFRKAGWQWRSIWVVWEMGYAQPWCLVSHCDRVAPSLYAWRFRQEVSFRDLKSDGFDWQQSQVWQPAHTERLLFLLALALFWTLAMGTIVLHLYPLTKRQQRFSLFRLGLDALFARFRSLKPTCLELYLVPDTPLLKTVVL